MVALPLAPCFCCGSGARQAYKMTVSEIEVAITTAHSDCGLAISATTATACRFKQVAVRFCYIRIATRRECEWNI